MLRKSYPPDALKFNLSLNISEIIHIFITFTLVMVPFTRSFLAVLFLSSYMVWSIRRSNTSQHRVRQFY